MPNQLVKKSGIYFIGNLASKATMALIIPVYAFFVEPDQLGLFDFTQTLMQSLSPLLYLAIWEAALRYVLPAASELNKDESVSVIISFSLAISALLLAIGIVCAVVPGQNTQIISFSAIMSVSYGLCQVWQYLSRSQGDSKRYVTSGVVAAIVNFSFVLLLVCVLRLQLMGLCVSYVLGQVAAVFVIESRFRFTKRLEIRSFTPICLTTLLRYSVPLAVNLSFVALTTGVGRILITIWLGPDENGLYTFAMKFAAIITALGSIFAMAVVEEAILRIHDPNVTHFYRVLISNTAIFLVGSATVAIPLIAFFYCFISNTQYYMSMPLVPFFLVYSICVVLSTTVGSAYQAYGKTQYIAITSFASLAVTTILSIALIGSMGTLGAVGALAAGSLTLLMLRYCLAQSFVRYKIVNAKLLLVSGMLLLNICICESGIITSPYMAVLWSAVSVALLARPLYSSCKRINSISDYSVGGVE